MPCARTFKVTICDLKSGTSSLVKRRAGLVPPAISNFSLWTFYGLIHGFSTDTIRASLRFSHGIPTDFPRTRQIGGRRGADATRMQHGCARIDAERGGFPTDFPRIPHGRNTDATRPPHGRNTGAANEREAECGCYTASPRASPRSAARTPHEARQGRDAGNRVAQTERISPER